MQDRGCKTGGQTKANSYHHKQPQKHAPTDKEDTNKGVGMTLNGLEKLVESGQEKMQALLSVHIF
jgi:hypothetical protein